MNAGRTRTGQLHPVERRPAWQIVTATVLGAVAGLLIALAATGAQTTRYESTARLLVGPIGGERTTLEAAGLLARTYGQVLSSPSVISSVGEEVGATVDADDVIARADERSRILLVIVRHDDRDVPPRFADALAEELAALVAEGDPAIPGVAPQPAAEAGQVRIIDRATRPAEEIREPTRLAALVAAGVGGVLGWLWSRSSRPRRRTVDGRTLDELELPIVLAPAATGEGHEQLDAWDLAASQLDHACRWSGPYASLAYVSVDDDPEVADLLLRHVATEARHGRTVHLLDADPSHRVIGRLLPTRHPSVGANDPVGVVATGPDGHRIAPATADLRYVEPRPADDAPGAKGRVQQTAASLPDTDLLAVLAPPIGASPSAVTTAAAVDRVVLVVRRGRTSRTALRDGLDALATVGVAPAVVLDVARDLPVDPVGLHYEEAETEPAASDP